MQECDDLPDTSPVAPTKARFATINSDDDIFRLADERTSDTTKAQTRWAVRLFVGEFLHIYIRKCVICLEISICCLSG